MKQYIYLLLLLLPGATANAEQLRITVHHLNANGIGESAGVIIAEDTPQGLRLQPFLTGLKPGRYQFSVNENVGCGVEYRASGENVPGMAAGRQIRQLPSLAVDPRGHAEMAVTESSMQSRDIRGRTLVISELPSMPFDTGSADSQRRIACGSLEQYR